MYRLVRLDRINWIHGSLRLGDCEEGLTEVINEAKEMGTFDSHRKTRAFRGRSSDNVKSRDFTIEAIWQTFDEIGIKMIVETR
jgi:hypothetical protein